ncbi:HAD family hydrolase [Abyssalbus ytuae]|uniref:HAD family hydrolase n=1 Tax=Abyssalbus ytuae TaxID=2926907 RepID=A0A9E6ZMP1_9FLAO|nr:HAD family hydrolase [Abyssalbus ytuae]UOB17070.1 HAD family hydrolase [Abyssalbus ytuae]
MNIKVNDKTVIAFDLDDTLYNEIDYLKSAFHFIAEKLEKHTPLQLYSYMFSLYRSNKDVFGHLSSVYNITKEELLSDYRNHTPSIKPFDNVIDLLKKIRTHKGKTAIITDGRKTTQTNKIKSLGIYPLIDKIVISEDIGSEKPAAQNYQAIEKHFNAEKYIYIADNLKKDFITPKARGWNTIGLVDNGLNIHTDTHHFFAEKFKPEHFISRFSEIVITN